MEASTQNSENFEISINLSGSMKTILVKPEETTDGAEYFECILDDKSITQIRQEKDGSWEQIWGELNHLDIVTIGKAIAACNR